jgi:hypothetical protein
MAREMGASGSKKGVGALVWSSTLEHAMSAMRLLTAARGWRLQLSGRRRCVSTSAHQPSLAQASTSRSGSGAPATLIEALEQHKKLGIVRVSAVSRPAARSR